MVAKKRKKAGGPSAGKVLLVDDNVAWLNLIQMLAPRQKLTLCSRAPEALDLVRSGQVKLLITDTNMPGMTGIDLLTEVRKIASLKSLPVLVLFDGLHESSLTKHGVMQLGATAVLTKDEFLEQIDSLLGSLVG